MATRTSVNREIRGFAVVWTAITLLIGIATFFGIYLTYDGGLAEELKQGVSIPQQESPREGAVVSIVNSNATAVPTLVLPTATIAPTNVPVAVAQADTSSEQQDAQEQVEETPMEAQALPTQLPIDVDEFELGIQVQYSISFDPSIQNLWMEHVTDLGLGWMKHQVRWEYIEPADGEYDWSTLDLALPIAAEHNIKVMLSTLTTPAWAREPGVNTEEVGPPANYQDYVDFVVDMVERYPGMIHGIEVWNEQNLDREWMSTKGLSASDYVELLRMTYQAVKEVDPGIIIISGALSPTGGLTIDGIPRAIEDFDYMDQMIAAGLLNYTDCVGAHHNGYNIGPSITWDAVPPDPNAQFRGPFDNPHHSWSFRSTLQTYANKIAVAGGDQKLCVTEFGWPSVEDLEGYPAGFEFALDNTLAEQGEYTVEAIHNMIDWDIVRLAFIWNLNYGPQSGWDPTSDNTPYSLLGPNWTRRPAYEGVKAWSAERMAQAGQ